jgi:hypothetical protein
MGNGAHRDARRLRADNEGVPIIVINGWKLGVPPDAVELERMVRAIFAGESPVPAE